MPPATSGLLTRIDHDHANPRRLWREMGEPSYPSRRQIEALRSASALCPEPHPLRDGVAFDFVMPPQSVASLKIQLAGP